ncbi:alpha/beta hydrolase [Vibrio sp. AK197]
MKIKQVLLLAATLSTAFSSIAANSDSKELSVEMSVPPIRLNSDFVYAQTFNNMGRPINLSMDVIQPFSKTPLPAVLFVTGGGFMDAPKTKFIGQRVDMARAGYVVASINYRVVPMVTFPGMLEDVKSAVRYMRANAKKFGIDPSRIAVMGESAGGYLAAITATTNGMHEFDKGDYLDQSSDVQAAIDLYGLSDLTRVAADFSKERQKKHQSPAIPEAMLVNGIPFQAGGSIQSDLDKAAKANPITYISKATPPFLLMHGDADPIVSPSQTQILHQALIESGVDSTRYVVKGADHAGFLWYQPEIMDVIIQFLDEKLK